MLPTRLNPSAADEILQCLERIEKKLDFFIRCLDEEDDMSDPLHDLDGNPAGAPRDASEPLS